MFSWHSPWEGAEIHPYEIELRKIQEEPTDNCVVGHLDPEVTLVKKSLWGSQHQSLGSTEMFGVDIVCRSVAKLCPNLQSHRSQHIRLPWPSLSPRVCSNSCPLNWWCHPTISSSVPHPFSSCPQFFPASGSFPMSQLFESGGQSIGASASVSVLPMSIQCCFPLGLTGLISLQSNRLSRVFSSTTIQKHQFFGAQPSLWSNSHVRTWLLEKPHLWLYRPFYQGVATPGKDQTTETCVPGQRMNQVF